MTETRWPEVRFQAMGCLMAAWLDAPPDVAQTALAAVPDMMWDFEQILSRFLPHSDLSQLNARPQEAVHVSESLFEVVACALAMAEATDGLFDPTLLEALEVAGYNRSFDEMGLVVMEGGPAYPVISTATQAWRAIHLDYAERTIMLPPNVRLDLGGIAKGWAAQQVADVLAEHGPCLVDAGGDLVAVGMPEGLPGWPVALAEPGDGERVLLNLWLRDASVATSGVDRRRWLFNEQIAHHLIDPRTGLPAISDVVTATVIASDAVEAEAWAKLSLLLGSAEGVARLTEQSNLAGALLSEDGTLYFTSTMRRYLDAGE